MLTIYLDESLEANDGFAVIAGFVGDDIAWNLCVSRWREVLKRYGKTSLHLKTLRGWDKYRPKKMLAELGVIPRESGLTLLFSAVRVADYRDIVRGSISDIYTSGYLIALGVTVSMAMTHLPADETYEVICEHQHEYAGFRESFLTFASEHSGWVTRDGSPRLAKWSAVPKATILEPSDFAAYALLQVLRNPNSIKSQQCASILEDPNKIGRLIGGSEARKQISDMVSQWRNHPMDSIQASVIRRIYREDWGFSK